MKNPELYPAGWTFRVFTKWSNKRNTNAAAETKAATAATAASAATAAVAKNRSELKSTDAAAASPRRAAPTV